MPYIVSPNVLEPSGAHLGTSHGPMTVEQQYMRPWGDAGVVLTMRYLTKFVLQSAAGGFDELVNEIKIAL